MSIVFQKIYTYSPNLIQNIIISTFNILQSRIRYTGKYKSFRKLYRKNVILDREKLNEIQTSKLKDLVRYSVKYSPFYNRLYEGIDIENFTGLDTLGKLPIINKELIRNNIDEIVTIKRSEAITHKTGGTTGKSLKVYFSKENIQERFALYDNFRSQFGYKLGKKTAWFSGKSILTVKDIKQNRFWKTDYLYKIRYYSTFHIKPSNLEYYANNLLEYMPEYLVGFPSTIYDIARYCLSKQRKFPPNMVKAIFPTAETITTESRLVIEQFFQSKIYDQYASSEGAPWIFECKKGNLHMELQSGVFEVLDSNNNHVDKGRLIVTSFTTYGTPLIRYDIGDEIELSGITCTCGNNNPLVKKIHGRINDYIFSPEVGKINLGNVSNSLKGVNGIIKFQIVQDKLNELQILAIKDPKNFIQHDKEIFIENIRARVGNKMEITLTFVNDIPVEKSGKYNLVKNNIKGLLESVELG